MREPAYHVFRITRNRTFNPTLTWKDDAGGVIDLTGWDAKLQARAGDADDAVAFEFTVDNNRLALGGVAGTIALTMAPADTAVLAEGRYVYDLEVISPGGIADSLLYGEIEVADAVTR